MELNEDILRIVIRYTLETRSKHHWNQYTRLNTELESRLILQVQQREFDKIQKVLSISELFKQLADEYCIKQLRYESKILGNDFNLTKIYFTRWKKLCYGCLEPIIPKKKKERVIVCESCKRFYLSIHEAQARFHVTKTELMTLGSYENHFLRSRIQVLVENKIKSKFIHIPKTPTLAEISELKPATCFVYKKTNVPNYIVNASRISAYTVKGKQDLMAYQLHFLCPFCWTRYKGLNLPTAKSKPMTHTLNYTTGNCIIFKTVCQGKLIKFYIGITDTTIKPKESL
jgi:hypothetical protein